MVLDKLSDSLKNTLKKITSAVFVDEKLVNELVKDVQRSLLQSDVNVKLVLDLTNKIKERVLKEESPKTLSKKESSRYKTKTTRNRCNKSGCLKSRRRGPAKKGLRLKSARRARRKSRLG